MTVVCEITLFYFILLVSVTLLQLATWALSFQMATMRGIYANCIKIGAANLEKSSLQRFVFYKFIMLV